MILFEFGVLLAYCVALIALFTAVEAILRMVWRRKDETPPLPK